MPDPTRFLLDECTRPLLAVTLRKQGYDAVHVNELGREGLSDLEQIAFAREQRRAIVTYNLVEFTLFHETLLASGAAGILVAKDHNRQIGAFLRNFEYTIGVWMARYPDDPEWMRDRLIYLVRPP